MSRVNRPHVADTGLKPATRKQNELEIMVCINWKHFGWRIQTTFSLVRTHSCLLSSSSWSREWHRVPAGIIEHLRFEVRLAQKTLSWQDCLCTRRFSQDSLVITAWIWLLQLCLPKVQGLRAEVGGGGNYWTVGANVEQLGILAKNGAHGNIVKSYLELNFIRENTCKKAAVNASETI